MLERMGHSQRLPELTERHPRAGAGSAHRSLARSLHRHENSTTTVSCQAQKTDSRGDVAGNGLRLEEWFYPSKRPRDASGIRSWPGSTSDWPGRNRNARTCLSAALGASAKGTAIIASATMSTSVSPKLYSKRPATRKVTMAATEPR